MKVVFCKDNFHVWFQKKLYKSCIYKKRLYVFFQILENFKWNKDDFHVFQI